MPYAEPKPKLNVLENLRAETFVVRVARAQRDLEGSPVNEKLAADLIPEEHAGAFVAHSICVLAEAGYSDVEISNFHASLVETLNALRGPKRNNVS